MEIAKPSEDDKEYFRSVVEDLPGVEVKPMFGNLAAFVNGNMFCGLFGPAVGVRLPESARDELLAVPGAAPFGPEDRPMKEYVALPPAWRNEAALTDEWVARALEHTSSMPPKAKKAKKRT